VIPVKAQGSTLVGGAPLAPDGTKDFGWFVYC